MPVHHTVEDGVIQTHQVDFDYSGGPAFNMAQIPANATILQVHIIIFTEFDDAATTIDVGDSIGPSDLVSAGDVDVTKTGLQTFGAGVSAPVAIDPIVTVGAGASTQGEGRVLISYIEAS